MPWTIIKDYVDTKTHMLVILNHFVICQSVFYHIWNVNSIRENISHDSAATIIHAFITSRLDNGSAPLYNINDNLLTKLQLVQNAAARILTKTPKYNYMIPVLKELHWLSVHWRIVFKLLLLTWKCVNDKEPSSLQELIVPYCPARQLHSSKKLLLSHEHFHPMEIAVSQHVPQTMELSPYKHL